MNTTLSADLPRELVLASAGTGKTYRVSSRIIRLLAAGSRPDAIFASTFTRKAAGEILNRVLERLADAALDENAARELARSALEHHATPEDAHPERWLSLLRRVVRDLHRLNIGTIDAFFVRAATTFGDELALPRGWSIGDRAQSERVLTEGLHALLSDADTAELVELVRGLHRRGAERSVHDSLLRTASALLDLHHSLADPATAWTAFDAIAGRTAPVSAERRAEIAGAFEAARLPTTASGEPNQTWRSAVVGLAEQVRAGDWDGLAAATLCRNARTGQGSYARKPIPEEIHGLIEDACAAARVDLARRLATRSHAAGELAQRLAETVERARRDAGAYGFADVTRRLGGPDALCHRPDLYYRLDARVQHILLDEFQDTSLAQWEALEPLVAELLSGYEGERAAVVVADPKQSIYGWRGGEPALVRHVGNRFGLGFDALPRSYRSSQVVLDAVNEVFSGIDGNGVLMGDERARAAAEVWNEDFAPHTAARTLPGHVRMVAGPPPEGRSQARPELVRYAAQLVADLHQAAPERTIGVLARTNPTVARIILELRSLGIEAGEEGGNPLTDSAAVCAFLSLLRLVDHPGDRIARRHVASTTLGGIVGIHDAAGATTVGAVSERLRRRLIEVGYGRTLADLAGRVRDDCHPRDARRLAQLVELGFRYDERATLRTCDFIATVEAERIADPTAARVQAMTIHKSKGLEFDAVVLPELEGGLVRGRADPYLAFRGSDSGRIDRAFPNVNESVRALFDDIPELHHASAVAAEARWRDALSGLYVALTRARHALHLVVSSDVFDDGGKPKKSTARTAARVIRAALAPDREARTDDVLYEAGDPGWYETVDDRPHQTVPHGAAAATLEEPDPLVRLRPAPRRPRSHTRVSPSSLAGSGRVRIDSILRLERGGADRGTLVHAWFERVGWLDDGVPDDQELTEIARAVAPAIRPDAVDSLRARFRGWLAAPEIREVLHRNRYGGDATVQTEVRFLHRAKGRLVEGVIDRLVVLRENHRVTRAEIIDWKTDSVPDAEVLAALIEHYRPQMEAYRAAVAADYRLDPGAVDVRLVLLDLPTTRTVRAPQPVRTDV